MGRLNFTKMVGAGNDFIVFDARLKAQCSRLKGYVKRLCERKTGIGADGVLVLEKSKVADFKMRIFNADGSVAEMCGNGLRCAILYAGVHGCTPVPQGYGAGRAPLYHKGTGQAEHPCTTRVQGRQSTSKRIKVEIGPGVHEGETTGKDRVRVKMGEPKGLRLNFPINVNGRTLNVNFINTGVPHTVVFVEGLDEIDTAGIGSTIRYHDEFKPKGANVNFAEIIDGGNIKIRTYERGVEGETLACGTGSAASAIISTFKAQGLRLKVDVHTRGGILKVEFDKIGNKIKNVYLEGEAREVFKGDIIL